MTQPVFLRLMNHKADRPYLVRLEHIVRMVPVDAIVPDTPDLTEITELGGFTTFARIALRTIEERLKRQDVRTLGVIEIIDFVNKDSSQWPHKI